MNKWEEEENQFDFEADGLVCAMRRGPGGFWCGYVGVPDNHKWHGKDYGEKVKVPKDILEREIDVDKIGAINFLCVALSEDEIEAGLVDIVLAIDVHGGITYAKDHKPKGEKDGLWWFGFDCGHTGDFAPKYDSISFGDEIYRDAEYVRSECASMAKQLSSFA